MPRKRMKRPTRRQQRTEARKMQEHLDKHRSLPRGSGYAAIRRADKLLAKYGQKPLEKRKK